MDVEIIQADYADPKHRKDIPLVLSAYASDPMGGGVPLSDFTKTNLVDKLSALGHAFTILAYVDGEPAGLVNCLEGFSSFACHPLINIHDVVVLENFRGHGLSQSMLQKVGPSPKNGVAAKSRSRCSATIRSPKKPTPNSDSPATSWTPPPAMPCSGKKPFDPASKTPQRNEFIPPIFKQKVAKKTKG